jgi:hypothetical protein
MNYRIALQFSVKLIWLITVLGLLVGHGSTTGPNETPGYIAPCGGPVRATQPYYCIDGEDTEQDIQLLSGMTVIDRDLAISGTDLQNLDFLSEVTQIQGTLSIIGNAALTSIATASLELTEIDGLIVRNNNSLTSLQGFDAVSQIPGKISISENAVLTSLGNMRFGQSIDSLYVDNNPLLQDISAAQNLITIQSDMQLWNSGLSSLNGFAQLETIGGILSLRNLNIESLAGLDSLTTITSTFFVLNCSNLLSLEGIGLLTSYGALSIYGNPLLTSINLPNSPPSGLEFIIVGNNELLTDISALSTVQNVSDYVRIANNNSLSNLQGLDGLVTIAGELTVSDNLILTSISALAGVQSVGSLFVERNTALNQLGMSAITRVDADISLRDNSELCEQDAQALVDQINAAGGVGGSINLTGNKVCP